MGRIRSIRQAVEKLARSGTDAPFRIPLEGGGVAEFSKQDMVEAYLVAYKSAISGTPAEHPLLQAMKRSSDPTLRGCYSDMLDDPADEPAKDLSVTLGE